MNSPSDNASFHTADSMESSLTEVDGSISNYDSGEDDQQVRSRVWKIWEGERL